MYKSKIQISTQILLFERIQYLPNSKEDSISKNQATDHRPKLPRNDLSLEKLRKSNKTPTLSEVKKTQNSTINYYIQLLTINFEHSRNITQEVEHHMIIFQVVFYDDLASEVTSYILYM